MTAVSGTSAPRSCWLTPPALEAPSAPHSSRGLLASALLQLLLLHTGRAAPRLDSVPRSASGQMLPSRGGPWPASQPYLSASPTLPLGPLWVARPHRKGGGGEAWWRPSLPRVGDVSTHGDCDPRSPHYHAWRGACARVGSAHPPPSTPPSCSLPSLSPAGRPKAHPRGGPWGRSGQALGSVQAFQRAQGPPRGGRSVWELVSMPLVPATSWSCGERCNGERGCREGPSKVPGGTQG